MKILNYKKDRIKLKYIIDNHAHIFPDKIAQKASDNIGHFYENITMHNDGSVNRLLQIGEEYQITRFVVHSVATRPDQVHHINDFIAQAVAEHPNKFIGFASVHPDMEDLEEEINRAIKLGLKGVKLHPDFQQFALNEKRAYRLYEICEGRLPLLLHMGDYRYHFSSPKYIPQITKTFPKLQLICAHFGGWTEWQEAEEQLKGLDIWVDSSSSLFALPKQKVLELIQLYGEDRVIFGSDYPMWNPGEEVKRLQALNLSPEVEDKIFYQNICNLLQINIEN